MKSGKKKVRRKKRVRNISTTTQTTLPPPKGYDTWLDYAVQTMDTRELDLDHHFEHLWGNQPQWAENVQRADFGAAAVAELAALREIVSAGKKPKLRAAKGNFSPQPRIQPLGIAPFDALARLAGPALVDRINTGVDARAFVRLAAAYGVPADELAVALGRNARTLLGRTRLSGDETEVAFRAYRVLVRAREVLESEKNASKWMRTPLGALAGRTPLSLLARDVGEAEVLNVLGRIEHSVIL